MSPDEDGRGLIPAPAVPSFCRNLAREGLGGVLLLRRLSLRVIRRVVFPVRRAGEARVERKNKLLELEESASEISYDEDEDQFSLDSELDDESDEEDESEDEHGQTKSPVISNRYRRKMEQLEQRLGLKGMGFMNGVLRW